MEPRKNLVEISEQLPKVIYVKLEFRIEIFCKAYCKAGSLSKIGIAMGYSSRPGLNGVARDMWVGKRGIPQYRIAGLLKLTGVPMRLLIENLVSKEEFVEIDDWMKYYEEYKLRSCNMGKR